MKSNVKFGGQIFLSPQHEKLKNIYFVSDIERIEGYEPFTKKVFVYGFTLYGTESASDEFLLQIVDTIKAMFPETEGIDRGLQEAVLQNIYQFNSFIPVLTNKEIDFMEDPYTLNTTDLMKVILEKHSIADVLRTDGKSPPLEVVEHLLHFITIIGLANAIPKEWGYKGNSKLLNIMEEAKVKKIYDISGFLNEVDDKEAEDLMIIKEFGYWIISSCWEVQSKYGFKTDEWALTKRNMIKEFLPSAYELFQNTISKIMVDPCSNDLEKYIKEKGMIL